MSAAKRKPAAAGRSARSRKAETPKSSGAKRNTSTKKRVTVTKTRTSRSSAGRAARPDYPDGKGLTKLKPDDRFEIALAVQAEALDDEFVILDPLTNQAFRANSTATEIWTGVGQHVPIADIARQMAERHGIPVKYAEELTEAFLEELRTIGLVAKLGGAD